MLAAAPLYQEVRDRIHEGLGDSSPKFQALAVRWPARCHLARGKRIGPLSLLVKELHTERLLLVRGRRTRLHTDERGMAKARQSMEPGLPSIFSRINSIAK